MDAFLDEVDRELLPKVRDQRFANGGALIRRYRGAKVAWNKGRARVGALDETVNEISVACEFLASAECTSLHYETPVADTGKTIDFLVFRSEERPIYFDVKTVHPDSGNSWAAYERMQRHFTPGTNLLLEEDWMGGEIAHDFMQARRRFLEHTLCLEDKIESIGAEDSFYALIFCSNAFKWHEDHLEDFADFLPNRTASRGRSFRQSGKSLHERERAIASRDH